MEVLAPVNTVLAGNFVSPDIRFIICARANNFEDVSFSDLSRRSMLSILTTTHQARTIITSAMNAMPKIATKELIPRFALFEAVVSVSSFVLHAVSMMSLENFVISLQHLDIATADNQQHIWRFLADYYYATENL